MSIPGSNVRPLPFLSDPTWDISDEEIEEWSQVPGKRLAACVAAQIRDGVFDNGREIFPPGSMIYREITRERTREIMGLLIERGMVRETGGKWYAITPGRMEPSIRRAVSILLDRRTDLPASLAAELDSWKEVLDSLETPGGIPANGTGRTGRRNRSARNYEKQLA